MTVISKSNVVILADKNSRAAITCLRSLSRQRQCVDVYPAISATTHAATVFVSYTHYPYRTQLLRYDDRDELRFFNSLVSLHDQIGSYILFPTGERVLRWATRSKQVLHEIGVTVPTVDFATYQQASDKESFAQLASSFGITVPTLLEEIPRAYASKFVVKPKKGTWGRCDVLSNPVLVESKAALEKLRSVKLKTHLHFAQQYVEGPSYYYCALYNKGAKRMEFTQKTLIQQPDGKSVIKAEPAEIPPPVQNALDHMMCELEWHGVMMIELKESGGDYYAIECNPRFWGPLQLAMDNDIDFPLGLWQLATEEGQGELVCNPDHHRIGYLWRSGLLEGQILKAQSGTDFQRWVPYRGQSTRYKDVWFRTDTVLFYLVEPLLILGSAIKQLLKGRWAWLRKGKASA